MLLAVKLNRVFSLTLNGNKIKLTDPEPNWSVEAVMNYYANTYPVLTTCKASEPHINDDTIEYHFESVIGTKG